MHKLLTFTVCFFLALVSSSFAKESKAPPEDKIWNEWAARGKIAKAKVEEILKKGEISATKSKVSAQEMCDVLMESAYAKFTKPEALRILKGRAMGMDGYTLLIDSGDNKVSTQLTFFYADKSKAPFGIAVVSLPEGWSFVSAREGAWLEGDGCRFIFDLNKPLSPKVNLIKPEKE